MGHYRSEMACDRCGNMRCTCPRTPTPVQWLIDTDGVVMTTAEHDKKHSMVKSKFGPIQGTPLIRRMRFTLYPTKEDAALAVPNWLREQIAGVNARIAECQEVLADLEAKLAELEIK